MNSNRLLPLRDGIYFHASGGLWIAGTQTLLLADLHLGFTWAQRRRGELWPLTDGGAQDRLLSLCRELSPLRMVLLGDVVHAPRPSQDEQQSIETTLASVRRHCEVICLEGNHDRGCGFASEWRMPGLRALHGHVLPSSAEPGELIVAGHFHPILRYEDSAGVLRAARTFLHGNGLCVLPAFSPFSTGCNMRFDMAPELRAWFRRHPVDVVLTSGERLLRLPPHGVRTDGFRPLTT
jgi:metallophosphoesterase superfamily enzyme